MFVPQHNIKTVTQKGVVWIAICVIGALILALIAGSVLVRSGTKSSPLPQPAGTDIQPEAKPKAETDFVEQGVTIENCQFFYDRPGALALTADLIFVETSICDVGNGEQPCAKVNTSILRGQSTKIEGHVEQSKKVQIMGPGAAAQSFPSVITVHKLTILKEIAPVEFGGEACVPSKEYPNP
jgi:hypothetical protein